MSQSGSPNPEELRRLVNAFKRGERVVMSMDAEAWRTAPGIAVMELRGVLRELWGSYRSLVAVTGREDAMQWDGPCCVRSNLGEDF